MAKRLDGRAALVTGAATGIGRATADRLAREGATVVAGIAGEGQRPGVSASDAIVLDARSEADWDRAIANVEQRHGGLDILVNNAGIRRRGTAPRRPRARSGTRSWTRTSGAPSSAAGRCSRRCGGAAAAPS